MRRFTRLTNAFSKKAENHLHALALYFMFYNFGRIHKTLRVSPDMIKAHHAKPAKRGPYKKLGAEISN